MGHYTEREELLMRPLQKKIEDSDRKVDRLLVTQKRLEADLKVANQFIDVLQEMAYMVLGRSINE